MTTLTSFEPLKKHPKLLEEIRILEERLKCRICYQLLQNVPVVSSKCSHNFCSICVRQSLQYRSQCPDCFEDLHESELRPNKIVRDIQDLLISRILPSLSKTLDPDWSDFNEAPAPRTIADPDVMIEQVKSKSDDGHDKEKRISSADQDKVVMPTQSISKPKASPIKAEKAKPHVACPVCSVSIPEQNINLHLDRCLPDEARIRIRRAARPTINSLKPVRKVVYHLLKDNQLKKIVKEAGLDCKGDRQTLIQRHRRFAVIWNAQCDQEQPLSKMQILMRVQKEELSEKSEKAATNASRNELLHMAKSAGQDEIESKKKEYLSSNKSAFAHLIAQVKQRQTKKVDDPKANDILDPADSEKANSGEEKGSQSVSEPMTPGRKRKSTENSDDHDGKKMKGDQNELIKALERSAKKPPKKSACPACQQMVPTLHINAHLDRCLADQETSTTKRGKQASDKDIFSDSDESDTTSESIIGSQPPRISLPRQTKSNATFETDESKENIEAFSQPAPDASDDDFRADSPPRPKTRARKDLPARVKSSKRLEALRQTKEEQL